MFIAMTELPHPGPHDTQLSWRDTCLRSFLLFLDSESELGVRNPAWAEETGQPVECLQNSPDNLNVLHETHVISQEWWWAFVIAVLGKQRPKNVGGFPGHLA